MTQSSQKDAVLILIQEHKWIRLPGKPDCRLPQPAVTNNAAWGYRLSLDSYQIGRDGQKCNIVVAHDKVSREHAKIIRQKNGEYQITDLGSLNGTQIQGNPDCTIKKQEYYTLQDGDIIAFANMPILRFRRVRCNAIFGEQPDKQQPPSENSNLLAVLSNPTGETLPGLSSDEQRVFDLIKQSRSVEEIAISLGKSKSTIKRIQDSIDQKQKKLSP